MNKQEIFDKIVQHARVQKKRAIERGRCKYRTEDGLKCFIGALIPDEKYTPDLENILNQRHFLILGIDFSSENFDFLSSLQRMHDDSRPCEWEAEFQNFAHKYGLTYSPPINNKRK